MIAVFLAESHQQGKVAFLPTASSSSALGIVGWHRRCTDHQYVLKLPDVDTHLQRRRGNQTIEGSCFEGVLSIDAFLIFHF